jgi:uncharacterized HAD superfamily protein
MRQSKHKARDKTGQSNSSIDKPDNQITNKPINIYRFRSLTITVEEFEKWIQNIENKILNDFW